MSERKKQTLCHLCLVLYLCRMARWRLSVSTKDWQNERCYPAQITIPTPERFYDGKLEFKRYTALQIIQLLSRVERSSNYVHSIYVTKEGPINPGTCPSYVELLSPSSFLCLLQTVNVNY